MDLMKIVCLWNDQLKQQIKQIVNQCDFPLFIRLLAIKQQFWYACVWMSIFTGQYFEQYPKTNLNVFFKNADKIIASMPDLFNDELYMQAHGLLWKYGFKRFFNNINYAVQVSKLLFKKTENNIN